MGGIRIINRDPQYEYTSSYIYYDTFKGMFGVTFIFGLCAYYGSLCHSIISLCKVYNARQRLGKMYIVFPIIFAFFCLIISTFILQDTGIKDFLVDGITDGSLSELLHVVVIFMLVPYIIYSIWVVYNEHQKLAGQNSQQQSLSESGVLADKDLFSRHIKYTVIFLITIMPGCLVELLPMLWKTIPRSLAYRVGANVAAVCFSCSGIGLSVVRLYDPYVKEKIQLAIASWLGGEPKEISIELVDSVPDILQIEERKDDYSSISPSRSTRSLVSSRSPRKTIFEQAEERAVYDVHSFFNNKHRIY